MLEQPPEKIPTLLVLRVLRLLARAARQDASESDQARALRTQAVESAEKLRTWEAGNADNLYNATCAYALCAAADEASRDKLVEQALTCLREAVAAGFKDVASLQEDADLAVLRDLPEFQKIVADLAEFQEILAELQKIMAELAEGEKD